MPDTLEAVAAIVLALLPGALYVWAFERPVGAWGIRLTDRILRFVGVSAVLHALAAPLTYALWVGYVRSGRLAAGRAPVLLWLAVLAYVALPIALGTVVGRATQRGRRWATVLTGPNPAPRAWDYLFESRSAGWVRLRLKSGTWIGGAYGVRADGVRSYVAGYPDEQDLFLAEAAHVDEETGEFVLDAEGAPALRGSGILVRWSEVEYLDFFEPEEFGPWEDEPL
jgi:hypothetical protein